MGFCFSKPKKKELLAESRERIQSNSRVLAVCLQLADDEEDISRRINRICDDIMYLTPTAVAAAAQADKKIGALAGDLKIALVKGKERDISKAQAILRNLELATVERNSYK